MSSELLRLVVVDDHPAVLEYVGTWIAATGIAEVVATANTSELAVRTYLEYLPDIVLCDIHLGDADGADCVRAILQAAPEARIAMFSARDDEHEITRCLGIGAIGFVSKNASIKALADTLATLATPTTTG